MRSIHRKTFLSTAAGLVAGLAASAPGAGQAVAPSPSPPVPEVTIPPLPNATRRLGRSALVFSGGGARGAYEAGIVAGVIERLGIPDGQPLPYDVICGTSIGGMNAYMTAAAQYTRMRQAWEVIPGYHAAAVKSPYDRIRDRKFGPAARADAAVKLGRGVFSNLQGLLDPSGVWKVLGLIAQPTDAIHIPLYVAATNLTRGRGEIFVRHATTPAGLAKQSLNDTILANYRRHHLREMTDANMLHALFASAAMPVAFDPIMIEPDGGGPPEAFVDGGVTENVPIGLARRCCENLNVILVDPEQLEVAIPAANVIEIALGSFMTMQHTLLEAQARLAYAESAVAGLVATANSDSEARADQIPLTVGYVRPAAVLPGKAMDFSDAVSLKASWQVGYADGKQGWKTFVPTGLFN